MKNKLLLGTLLICIASLFTSCKDDNDDNPILQHPTSFEVNTPASTDQYIQLSKENTVHLTWSQPNYGYNALPTYSIQVGVLQADGTIKWCQKEVKDEDGNVIGLEDEYLSTTYTKCSADISGEEVALRSPSVFVLLSMRHSQHLFLAQRLFLNPCTSTTWLLIRALRHLHSSISLVA